MKSMDTKITCCFTGHRPNSLPFGYDEQNPQCIRMRFLIWNLLNKLITEKGVTHFISGMALGIDQICAEVVLELKARHPEITLECAFPCETQAVRWSESQRERYYRIAEQCDKETMLQHHFDKANLWLWSLRDFLIMGIAALLSVVILVQTHIFLPAAATLLYGFLSIRLDDMEFLDSVQSDISTARQFMLIVRVKGGRSDKQTSSADIERKLRDQGFDFRHLKKPDIKRILAIYFDASMYGEQMPDVDGAQFLEVNNSNEG